MSDVDGTEQWRPVPGYEGRYEVSDHGRVRSLDAYCGNRFGTRTLRKGRMLKLSIVKPHGYRSVQLADGRGNLTAVKVHRLVLLAFKGEPPPASRTACTGTTIQRTTGSATCAGATSPRTPTTRRERQPRPGSQEGLRLGHLLVAPNLVPSTLAAGGRDCLACKQADSSHRGDERLRAQGRERTRVNRGRDGFVRRLGESFQDEADRRYAHIMRDYVGGL
jgi:hypothetical protein